VSLGTLYTGDGALVGRKLAGELCLEVLFGFFKRCPDGLACRVKHPIALRATPATETQPSDPYQFRERLFSARMKHTDLTSGPKNCKSIVMMRATLAAFRQINLSQLCSLDQPSRSLIVHAVLDDPCY
jgi:hypothetical protein